MPMDLDASIRDEVLSKLPTVSVRPGKVFLVRRRGPTVRGVRPGEDARELDGNPGPHDLQQNGREPLAILSCPVFLHHSGGSAALGPAIK